MATTEAGVLTVLRNHGPEITSEASLAVAFWLEIQAVLYRYLPGPRNTGQRTLAGHLFSYRTNGLSAWIITHAIFATLCSLGRVDPAFIPENTPKMQGAL
jgi:7-dehydrocholesterol reductase